MSYPINYPTPQKSNFQAFYAGGTTQDWVKPQGASMVRMLLIGPGGGGFGGTSAAGGAGGGSGAVTQWIGPAMFIPDVLRILVGAGGAPATTPSTATSIIWQGPTSTTGYTLLSATQGTAGSSVAGGGGGSASSNNFFGAAGIFKSIAGQTGANPNTDLAASTTTFLSGGAGGASTAAAGKSVAGKYGYPALSTTAIAAGLDGYFLLQPIMVGFGGSGGGGSGSNFKGGNGGIGCGGGGGGVTISGTSVGGRGGDGAVFIWSW